MINIPSQKKNVNKFSNGARKTNIYFSTFISEVEVHCSYFSIRLVTKDTVDENIYEIARRKLVLDAAVLESGAELDDDNDVSEKTMGEILASLLLV